VQRPALFFVGKKVIRSLEEKNLGDLQKLVILRWLGGDFSDTIFDDADR
jgi:hypothetical protein